MASPNSKATLKEYIKRALGAPVLEINVDDDQFDDRIDEALQYFAEFHMDGVERLFLNHQITAAEKTRAVSHACRELEQMLRRDAEKNVQSAVSAALSAAAAEHEVEREHWRAEVERMSASAVDVALERARCERDEHYVSVA